MNLTQLSEQRFVCHPEYKQCRVITIVDNGVLLAHNANPNQSILVTNYELLTVSQALSANEYNTMCQVYRDYVADYEELTRLYGADYVTEYKWLLSNLAKSTIYLNGFKSWQHKIHYITDSMSAIALRQWIKHE